MRLFPDFCRLSRLQSLLFLFNVCRTDSCRRCSVSCFRQGPNSIRCWRYRLWCLGYSGHSLPRARFAPQCYRLDQLVSRIYDFWYQYYFVLIVCRSSPNDRGAYSLQVNITADVPLTNATQVSEEDGKTEFSTISILSLVGDTVAANTSICYSVWSGLSAKINSAAKGDSSQAGAGCGDMLSAQCISDLLTAGGQMNQTCHPAPFLPQSCMDQMAESFEGISLSKQ